MKWSEFVKAHKRVKTAFKGERIMKKKENINVFELRSLVALKVISKWEAQRYVRKKLGLDENGKQKGKERGSD